MALLVLPGGLMALSPQGPLTLLSMRALESCMARSARGLCPVRDALGELTRRNFPYNQRARAEQAGGPAGVPQHRMKSCPCRALQQGEVRVQSTGGSQLTERQQRLRTEGGMGGMAFFSPHTQRALCGTRRAQGDAAPFSEKLEEPQTGCLSLCPVIRMNNSLRCQLLPPEWFASLQMELLIYSQARV